MKLRHATTRAAARPRAGPARQPDEASAKKSRKSSRWQKLFILLLVLVVIFGIGRAVLPWTIRGYVNRTLDRNPIYAGEIGPVEVHLWRGAYSIRDVRLNKTT